MWVFLTTLCKCANEPQDYEKIIGGKFNGNGGRTGTTDTTLHTKKVSEMRL